MRLDGWSASGTPPPRLILNYFALGFGFCFKTAPLAIKHRHLTVQRPRRTRMLSGEGGWLQVVKQVSRNHRSKKVTVKY